MTRYKRRPLNAVAQTLRALFAPVDALVRWLPENIDWTGKVAASTIDLYDGRITVARWASYSPRPKRNYDYLDYTGLPLDAALTGYMGVLVQPLRPLPLPPHVEVVPEQLFARVGRGYKPALSGARGTLYRRVQQGKRIRYVAV